MPIPHMTTTSPSDDLYAFIFRMVESDPQFRVGPRSQPAAPLSKAMLARPYKGILPASYACEPKIDGVRVIVEVARIVAVTFRTRNGLELPSLRHLAPFFRALSNAHGVYCFDCEAVSGSDFFDGVGNIRSATPCLDAHMWLLDLPGHAGTYAERRLAMSRFDLPDAITLVPSVVEVHPTHAYRKFAADGFEGAMIKDTSAPYAVGKRSHSWLKVKAVDTEDCPIVSIHEGKGRLAGTMGYVVVQYGEALVRVGGGFTDAQRSEIWEFRGDIIGKSLEVSFQQATPSGSLRHPRVRGDK